MLCSISCGRLRDGRRYEFRHVVLRARYVADQTLDLTHSLIVMPVIEKLDLLYKFGQHHKMNDVEQPKMVFFRFRHWKPDKKSQAWGPIPDTSKTWGDVIPLIFTKAWHCDMYVEDVQGVVVNRRTSLASIAWPIVIWRLPSTEATIGGHSIKTRA